MNLSHAVRPNHRAWRARPIHVASFAATGAAAFGLLTLACWADLLRSLVGCNHVYVAFFSSGAPAWMNSLAHSLATSALGGAVAGAALAMAWNRFVSRRDRAD